MKLIKTVVLIFVLTCLTTCIQQPAGLNKNWILFTLDTLRQDHLGLNGNPRVKTPMLDKLARQGITFSQAIAESPWTIPSHASLMTSRFPRTHGATFQRRHLDDHFLTAAEVLKQWGYYCGGAVAALPASTQRGFHQGFDDFYDKDIALIKFGNEVTEDALTWFKQDLGRRFFFWGHFFDPHRPYNPPSPYDRMYEPDSENDFDRYYQLTRYLTKKQKGIKLDTIKREGITVTPEIAARALSLYDGEITFLDRELEYLLFFIYERGYYHDSIITFVADHGEYFGEKNKYFQHATDLGEPVLRIPMVMRIPSIRGGKIITDPVQLVDVLPTTLSLMDIPIMNYEFSGRNLKKLVTLGEPPRKPFVFSEFHPRKDWFFHGVRDGDMKYVIMTTKKGENRFLHDIKDGDEKTNLVRSMPEKADYYDKILKSWLKNTAPYEEKKSFTETEEMKENLRALGYLND